MIMLIQTRPKLVRRSQVHSSITMTVMSIEQDQLTLEAEDGPWTHRVELAKHELPLPADQIEAVQLGDRMELGILQ